MIYSMDFVVTDLVNRNDLTKCYDTGKQSDLIYMDIAKAFDTIPHNRLKLKLQWYGITGSTLQYMRCQRV